MSPREADRRPDVLTVRSLGTIVGVWAHPDDEAYLSAGLMAAAVDAGNRVLCITATRGELGTSDPTAWPPGRLGRLRERELRTSLAVVGVHDHVWLPYEDGSCDAVDSAEASALIAQVLDDVGADTVVTFGADGMTGHPDHVAAGRWATSAAARARHRPQVLYATKTSEWRDRYADLHRRLPIFGPAGPPATASPDVVLALELCGAALDRKIAALSAHRSQVVDLISAMGEATYRNWVADEYFTLSAQARPAPGG